LGTLGLKSATEMVLFGILSAISMGSSTGLSRGGSLQDQQVLKIYLTGILKF